MNRAPEARPRPANGQKNRLKVLRVILCETNMKFKLRFFNIKKVKSRFLVI